MIGFLEVGVVYRLQARNLSIGVWTGVGFIGIRDKWGNRYLDTEYLMDDRGTAVATDRIECIMDPIRMFPILKTNIGAHCGICLAPVQMGQVSWIHILSRRYDHESEEDVAIVYDHAPSATATPNRALFEILDRMEKELCPKV